MSLNSSFSWSRHALLLLGLSVAAACGAGPVDAPVSPDDLNLFGTGSEDEAAMAEEIAFEHLFARGGIVERKSIDGLLSVKIDIDELEMAHARVQQYQGDVPVFGGEAIVHLKHNGMLSSVTDNLIANVNVDTTPLYSAVEAMEVAVENSRGWSKVTDTPKTDLWVLRHDGQDHLAYRVQLRQLNGDADDAMPVVFIDAHTGEEIWRYDNLQTTAGTGQGYYTGGTVNIEVGSSSGSYRLYGSPVSSLSTSTWTKTAGNGNKSFSTSSDITASTVNFGTTDQAGVDAHWGAAQVLEYYYTQHGRNSYNNAGGQLKSTVHYSRNYVNAYWDGTGMTYGDGDGYYSNALTTLDIAGHEITHGVTEYTANLTYSGESGGLNESMSDVFGAAIEAYADGAVSANTWLLGEDCWLADTALRWMNDPAADGYSYDYYSSGMGSADVHYTSGVGNLAFYLLSEGGTHPRGKSTTSVTGVGIDAAAAIWYRALSVYMTASTDYAGARTATLNAASDLYGASSAEYTQVGNAWSAVGVGSSGGGGGGGGGSTCSTGYTAYSGSLSGAGDSDIQPDGTYYYSTSSGTHSGRLTGPSSADFDLYVYKYDSRRKRWNVVAKSEGSTSTESIDYSGSSKSYFYWLVSSYSGSGSYDLCLKAP